VLKRVAYKLAFALLLLGNCNLALAVNYTFPGTAAIPQILADATNDNLTVTGNMTNNAPSSINYTVETQGTLSGATHSITVNAGGTIGNNFGDAIDANMASSSTVTITNNGTLSATNSSNYAVNAVPKGSNATITVHNTGIAAGQGQITGNLLFAPTTVNQGNTYNLYIDGSFASVSGTIACSDVAGASLYLGQASAVNFTSNANITGFRTVQLFNGSLTTNAGLFDIDVSFITNSGTTTTFNGALSGIGYAINNGTMTFNSNGVIDGLSSLTSNNSLSIIGTTLNSSAIINNGTMTLSATLNGSGSITNNGQGTLIFAAGANSDNQIYNNGTWNVTGSSTSANNIYNYGTMNISSGFNNTAPFLNDGTININNVTFYTNGLLTTNGALNVSGSSASINGAITGGPGSIMHIGYTSAVTSFVTSGNIQGVQTISLVNGSNFTSEYPITGVNGGFVVGPGSYAILNAAMSGGGTVTIANGSTLQLNSGASLTDFNALSNLGTLIVNDSAVVATNISGGAASSLLIGLNVSANFTSNNFISDVPTITLYNGSMFTANEPVFDVSNAFTINAGSRANFFAPLSGSGALINNKGSLVSAAQISMGSYTGEYAPVMLIIDSATSFGSIISTGPVDMTGSTLTVNASNFNGTADTLYTWTIVQGSSLIAPATNSILIPANTFLDRWNQTTNTNSITLTNISHEYIGNNKVFIGIFEPMYLNPQNAAQNILMTAITNSQTQFNAEIQKFLPNVDSILLNLAILNDMFNKTEMRIAALRDGLQRTSDAGYMAGDLDPNHSMWIAGFGSITNLDQNGDNAGFHAGSLGTLLGFDFKDINDNAYGIAYGLSSSHIDELQNANYVTVTHRHHGLLYGTINCICDSYLDWLLTGSMNSNRVNRPFSIGGFDLSTNASYRGYQYAGKVIVGQRYEFNSNYLITPIGTAQYSFETQNAYNEGGSAAALHVAEQNNNILTLGAGAKLAFPICDWHKTGLFNFSAVFSYDFLNSNNNTVANFIAGSNDFVITNPPNRFATRLSAGMSFKMFEHIDLQLNYDFELRSNFTDHSGMVKIKYIF